MKCNHLLLVILALIAAPLHADDWPRFRGPNADGVAKDHAKLPEKWSKSENIQWSAGVPGWGWSCPVVAGESVFLTTVVSESEYESPKKGLYLGRGRSKPPEGVHHWLVYCFDLKTGKQRWKREVHRGEPTIPRHPKATYASETPATDGERVYALFGDVGLYCFDLDGKPLWSHAIKAKRTFLNYGAAASPVVHDGQVVVVYDNMEESYIASFDAKMGKQRWRTPREEPSTWATPFVWRNSLRTEIIVPGRRKNRAYDLSGKPLWSFDGRMSNLVIPSPFAAHGMLFVTSGYVGDAHRPVYAIKPGATGDITNKENPAESKYVEWYLPRGGPYNTSPIVYGDYYYTLYDRGFLTCHEARTGKEVYGKKRFAPGASFTASPWSYNGKLFFISEDGNTYVVRPGPEFKVLHVNRLDELCLSSPSVSQGKLLIRTGSKLYCFSKN